MTFLRTKIPPKPSAQIEVICPYCKQPAKLVKGKDLYPRHPDLHNRNYWRCDPCEAHVGCHTPNRRFGFDGTQPLGVLANAQLRHAKHMAHQAFDPIWQSGRLPRGTAYQWLADQLGIPSDRCHIGEFNLEQCQKVLEVTRRFHGNPV